MTTEELLLKIVLNDEQFKSFQKNAIKYEQDRANAIKQNDSLNRKYENDRLTAIQKNNDLNRKREQDRDVAVQRNNELNRKSERERDIAIQKNSDLNGKSERERDIAIQKNSQLNKKYYDDWDNAIRKNTALAQKQYEQDRAHATKLNNNFNKQTTNFYKDWDSAIIKNNALNQKASLSWRTMANDLKNLTVIGIGVSAAFNFISDALMKAADNEMPRKRFEELSGSMQQAEKDLILLQKASAGNLSDAGLIDYRNKLENLGFSFKTVVLSLDAIEIASDRFKVNWDKAFSAFEKFSVSGTTKGLLEIGVNANVLTAKVDELTLATGKTTDQLSDLEIQSIRTDAFISLYGTSLEKAGNKTKGVDDKAANLHVTWENFTDFVGGVFLPTFEAVFDAGESISSVFEKIFGKGQNLKKVFGDIVKYGNPIGFIALSFDKINKSIGAVTGTALGFIDVLDMVLIAMGKLPLSNSSNTGNGATGSWEEDKPVNDNLGQGTGKLKLPTLPTETKKDKTTRTGSRGSNTVKKDVEEIKEIVQAVDEIELLKEQIFNKISRGGLGARVIGTGGTIPTNNEDVKKILAIQYEEEYKLWEANYEKQQGKTRALYDAGISFANEFTNILNFGADSFGAKFLSYLNQAFNVASSVARILSLVAPTGGFGGILGGIIKFFGFAQGGSVPGVGDSDTVPAMLTPGEVVIRKSAVNKYGADFFNSFNGGSNSINTLGRYANGGIVSGGGGLQIEIIGNAKLTGKGSELRAVLSKENIRVKQSRSKR